MAATGAAVLGDSACEGEEDNEVEDADDPGEDATDSSAQACSTRCMVRAARRSAGSLQRRCRINKLSIPGIYPTIRGAHTGYL